MSPINDYFFGPYTTPQEHRLRAVVRNGVEHASVLRPNDPNPGEPTELAILTDATLPIDHIAVYFTVDGADPRGARGQATSGHSVAATLDAEPEGVVGETAVRHWTATIPGQPDGVLVRYRIDAWSSTDAALRWGADTIDPLAAETPGGREFAYHVDHRTAPDWTRDAIVYHIFVDRFASAYGQPRMREPGSVTGFYGGTIRGITEKLDYIASLGATCVWLSPVMDSPTYHGYNPTSFYDVSPRYGTNADLIEFIEAAHARGMRVMLDFIANHTSDLHPEFVAQRASPPAADAAWYTFSPALTSGYLAYYGVADMPVLRTDQPQVREYLIDAARHWLTAFGADGLRLDNVSGPTHAFWTIFQEGVKATHPDALTLGEISGDLNDIASYGGRLDACMDFPLARITRQVFAQRVATLDELLTTMEAQDSHYPALMERAHLLDNHDMHRFLWLAENDTRRLKLALTFLLTTPGTPIIYYGAEVGLSQRAGPDSQDVFARDPMPWGAAQQLDVLDYTRWLIGQRKQATSLRRGSLARVPVVVSAGEPRQVGAYVRAIEDEVTVVIFNNGETPADYSIDHQLVAQYPQAGSTQPAVTLLSPEGVIPLTVDVASGLAGTLPALSAVVATWRHSHAKRDPHHNIGEEVTVIL